ncbi:MAG: T9SS type A sorting domain-containing protein [Bacteroidales bacterium]|nr:T9SS type A sorting domain-containing protein [Bacteroidales bacterium]
MKNILLAILPLLFAYMGTAQTDTLFDGPVGSADCQAIWFEDNAILGWATGCTITRGYTDIASPGTYASYGDDSDGIGPSSQSTTDGVVSLGDGGVAVLTFGIPIQDGDGYDFAVFENSLNDSFLEMAFVEVSSDGVNYFRFPATSLTQTEVQIANGGSVNPREVDNLAGKHRVGWGTPFDLAQLSGIQGLDINNVTHVRLIDVVGCIDPQYATYDQYGHIINDPYPTPWGSSGFDLSGVAIMNGWRPTSIDEHVAGINILKAWPNPTTDVITLYNEVNGLHDVALYDIYGNMVQHLHGDGNVSVTLDLSSLPASIYFIKADGQTKKIVKK